MRDENASDLTARSATKSRSPWSIGQEHSARSDRRVLEEAGRGGPRTGSSSPGDGLYPFLEETAGLRSPPSPACRPTEVWGIFASVKITGQADTIAIAAELG